MLKKNKNMIQGADIEQGRDIENSKLHLEGAGAGNKTKNQFLTRSEGRIGTEAGRY
jgi:hypothetical protein